MTFGVCDALMPRQIKRRLPISRVHLLDGKAMTEEKKESHKSLVAASRVVQMRAVLKAIETQGRYCHPSELKEALGLTTNSIGHFCASLEKAGDLVRIDVLPRKYAVWGLASHPLPDMDELREKCREYRRRWK